VDRRGGMFSDDGRQTLAAAGTKFVDHWRLERCDYKLMGVVSVQRCSLRMRIDWSIYRKLSCLYIYIYIYIYT